MKLLLLIPIFYFAACGGSSKKTNTVIIGDSERETIVKEIEPEPKATTAALPKGAITANYKQSEAPFYGYVKNVNKQKGITTIAFENDQAPPIILNKRYGATLSLLRFDTFDSDLLLLDTKISDPQFHKYHLYILKNNTWLPVVKPFAIHESHKEAQQNPIFIDPDNSNNMFRYYSVFDIDDTNNQEYGWRLHNERVAILNK